MEIEHRERLFKLRIVKVVHTIAWAFFASWILLVPWFAARGELKLAALAIGVVAVEVMILVVNGFKCPLTAVAARYTEDRIDSLDIYLPVWLAKYNKLIFGSIYTIGVVFTVLVWLQGSVPT
jgi:hypothetical protein